MCVFSPHFPQNWGGEKRAWPTKPSAWRASTSWRMAPSCATTMSTTSTGGPRPNPPWSKSPFFLVFFLFSTFFSPKPLSNEHWGSLVAPQCAAEDHEGAGHHHHALHLPHQWAVGRTLAGGQHGCVGPDDKIHHWWVSGVPLTRVSFPKNTSFPHIKSYCLNNDGRFLLDLFPYHYHYERFNSVDPTVLKFFVSIIIPHR